VEDDTPKKQKVRNPNENYLNFNCVIYASLILKGFDKDVILKMIKYIITVRLPEENRIFQTYHFTMREGRVLFEDKNGNPKNFPDKDCFIEGVEE